MTTWTTSSNRKWYSCTQQGDPDRRAADDAARHCTTTLTFLTTKDLFPVTWSSLILTLLCSFDGPPLFTFECTSTFGLNIT